MAERKLPKPMTIGDEYLAAILDELKGLRAEMADGRTPVIIQNGPVELREGAEIAAAVETAGQEIGAALSEEPALATRPPAKSKRRSRR
jgi:hypothetical protein